LEARLLLGQYVKPAIAAIAGNLMIQISRKTAIVAAFIAVLYGCGRSPQTNRDRYLAKGKSYLAKQDFSRAILEFKNAAQALPKDAETYYQMGIAYSGAKDFRSAVLAYRKAISLNARHVGAQLKLAQILVATNDATLLKDAQNHLEVLLQATAATPEMLNTLGTAELKLGDIQDAMRNFQRALDQSPGDLASYIMLARVKLLQGDSKGAEEVLKKATNSGPNSADAHTVLGELYISQNRLPEAGAEFRSALEIDATSAPALMDLARLQLTLGQKQEAEQNFERLAGQEDYRSVYAIFLFQDGRRDEAIRELERLAKENPNDRQVRTNLVVAYRAVNRKADATRVLADALQKNRKDIPALLQRGETFLESERYAEAENDLGEVLRLLPTSPEVHYLFAKLHQARGEILTYKQELFEVLRLNPYVQSVRVELAQHLINYMDPKTAVNVLDSAPETQKGSLALLVQRNWASWAMGDMLEMRKGIDRGLSQERSTDLLIQDGLWKLRAGDAVGARSALEEALKIDPSDLRALQVLTESYKAQKNGPTPLQKVKEYATRQPRSAPVQDFLGVMLMGQGERSQARVAFNAAKQADPNFIKADLSLVQLDVVDGKLMDARKRLETVLSHNDGNTVAHLWLGNVEEMMGDHDGALAQFRKVVDTNPGNAQALNNLAYLLSEHVNKPDEALKYAEKAVELVSNLPSYYDTLGWIFYRKGLYDSAVKYLERANSVKQQGAVWKYHLAMAYAKAGDVGRGRATFEDALKLNPRLPEAKIAQEIVRPAH